MLMPVLARMTKRLVQYYSFISKYLLDYRTMASMNIIAYFSAKQFYCVETVCAPCGVVIAWTKFDKSESPTQILKILESIYQTEESRPDYICIDKACVVLRTAITNGSWERVWKKTSRFI